MLIQSATEAHDAHLFISTVNYILAIEQIVNGKKYREGIIFYIESLN